jgi:hypothetical protein
MSYPVCIYLADLKKVLKQDVVRTYSETSDARRKQVIIPENGPFPHSYFAKQGALYPWTIGLNP